MKKIIYFIAPVFVIGVIISCSKTKTNNFTPIGNVEQTHTNEGAANARLITSIDKISNTDLFKGIFFVQGPVVDEIKGLVLLRDKLNPGELNVLGNRADNTVDILNVQAPEAIDQFGKSIRSKDHQEIMNALNKMSDLLIQLGIDIGEGSAVNFVDDGKIAVKKEKWIIRNPFLVLRSRPIIKKTADDDDEFKLIEKETLVNDIVISLTSN